MKIEKIEEALENITEIKDSVAAMDSAMELAKEKAEDKTEEFEKITVNMEGELGAENQPVPEPPTFELDESLFDNDETDILYESLSDSEEIQVRSDVAKYFYDKLYDEFIENPVQAVELDSEVATYYAYLCPEEFDSVSNRKLNIVNDLIDKLSIAIADTYFDDSLMEDFEDGEDSDESLNEAANNKVTLFCTFEPYERYSGGGGLKKLKASGTDYLETISKLADKMLLYIDSDRIEEDDMTFDEVINQIEMSNGDGCDFIVELKDDQGNTYIQAEYENEYEDVDESLNEDTVKQGNKWVNKGDDGETHGEFDTKKEADAQRRAMFANGFKG